MENKITLRRLSNGNPTGDKLTAIQAGLISSALATEEAANFIAAHYQPDELQKVREVSDYLRGLAKALQPDIKIAEALAKQMTTKNAGAKVFNGGASHVRDGSAGKPVSIDDLNRKNRDYWSAK